MTLLGFHVCKGVAPLKQVYPTLNQQKKADVSTSAKAWPH